MDGISNLSDNLNKAREASGTIQGALGPKGLSINQSNTKYVSDKNKKYQPSGEGGTCSQPATPYRLQQLTAC